MARAARFVSIALGLLSVGLLPSACLAQATKQEKPADQDSPRHQEWVQIKTKSGGTLHTLIVFPEVDKPAPTVVIIHENKGLTPWERRLADQLAEAGFVAVAPDLLSGTGPNQGNTDSFETVNAAREAIYKLRPDKVLEELDAVVSYARALEASNKKVAVAGFCWGGGQAFRYAAHNSDIAAAFVFYGVAPTDEAVLSQIEAPVYGFYGGNDFRITGQVSTVTERMNKLKKRYEPVIYEDAGHGFMRAGEQNDAKPADQKARQQGWDRWTDLLKKS